MDVDKIILRNIPFELVVGLDAWRRADKAQPVSVTIHLSPKTSFEAAALEDDVLLTIDYGKLYKKLSSSLNAQTYSGIDHLATEIVRLLPEHSGFEIEVNLPKAILQADSGLKYLFGTVETTQSEIPLVFRLLEIRRLSCACIIGVNPHERIYRQQLFLTIRLPNDDAPRLWSEGSEANTELHDLVKSVVEVSRVVIFQDRY